MLAQMIRQEVDDWLAEHEHLRDEHGRRQVVRNGFLPKRAITTGIGPVEVQQPRVRDRRPADEAEPFSSKILPPYLRKTKSVEELIPWLYLKGVSTGDFSDALKALVGPECPGLSATTSHDRLVFVLIAILTWDSMRRRAGRIDLLDQDAIGRRRRTRCHLGVGQSREFTAKTSTFVIPQARRTRAG
jgi:hypothetical protein